LGCGRQVRLGFSKLNLNRQLLTAQRKQYSAAGTSSPRMEKTITLNHRGDSPLFDTGRLVYDSFPSPFHRAAVAPMHNLHIHGKKTR